jgi:hypothetical protein
MMLGSNSSNTNETLNFPFTSLSVNRISRVSLRTSMGSYIPGRYTHMEQNNDI